MYILNIFVLEGGLASGIKVCFLPNLPGDGREITCPLKAQCWAITFIAWASALFWYPLFGKLFKERKKRKNF